MNILVNLHSLQSGVAIVTLEGMMTTWHANFLRRLLTTLIDGRVKRIVLDCASAQGFCGDVYDTIEEARVRCRQTGGDLRLAAVNDQILADLATHELIDDFVICSSRELAVSTFTV